MVPAKIESQTTIKSYPTTTHLDITQLNNEQQSVPKECRICLSDQSSQQNPLISPCKCTGSAKYVHYLCMTTWISLRLQARSSESKEELRVNCQICKQRIKTQLKIQNRCRDQKEIMEQIKANQKGFICALVSLLIFLALTAASIFQIVRQAEAGYQSQPVSQKASIILLLCFALLFTFYNLNKFLAFYVEQAVIFTIADQE